MNWLNSPFRGLAILAILPLCISAQTFEDKSEPLGVGGGSAACWVDLDNDGWTDLCAGGNVYRNLEGKRFEEIAKAGSCVAADFDNDGFTDLYAWNERKLYRNKDGTSFEAVELPELPKGGSQGAAWGDFDNDGFVDLYAGGYETWPSDTYADFRLTNRRGKTFEKTWSDARYRARGVTACDFDRDGALDVYVSNYRLQPNVLWCNDGKGGFADEAGKRGALAEGPGFGGGHSIGAAWGDFDNDGHIDLFAGNFAHKDGRGNQPESLWLRNRGPDEGHTFENKGQGGVFYQESYASPVAGDVDNDGDLDLFFTTVYGTASFGRKNNAVLFRNVGNFTFENATEASKLAGQPPAYQAAFADFDNDGDLDLMAAGKLWVNQGTPGTHWLKVRLQGDGKRVNRSAIGTQVRIKRGDKTLTRQVEAGTGQGNQNELALHFGLGAKPGPVALEIFWPDKSVQTVEDVKVDQVLSISIADK